MAVLDLGGVGGLDWFVVLEELDSSRHEVVDVAEVEEVLIVILVVIQFNAEGSILGPLRCAVVNNIQIM